MILKKITSLHRMELITLLIKKYFFNNILIYFFKKKKQSYQEKNSSGYFNLFLKIFILRS